ncbi:MAG: MFS transporter [Janthinobacterium lividum]
MSSQKLVLPYSVGRAWYATAALCFLYALSFVDRLIPSLLAAPISARLHITDGQMGVMFGVGFGVLYTLIGFPLAHLIDNHHRIRIVAAGVLIWSISTIASGFATDYWHLVVCRSGVAVGEAVLSPAAVSLIADMFIRQKRTLPMSIYMGLASLMTGAYILGGLAYKVSMLYAGRLSMEPWQLTFVIVGLPGVIVALLLLTTVREPVRVQDRVGKNEYASVSQALRYVSSEKRLYGFLFLGMCVYSTGVFAIFAWTPTLLVRGYGLTPAQAGYAFGTAGLVAGVIGTIFWPSLMEFFIRRKRPGMTVVLLAIGMPVAMLGFAYMGVATSVAGVLTGVVIFVLGGTAGAVLYPVIIQYVAPARVRGRLMAGNLMASGLVGTIVGPSLSAWIAGHFFSGTMAYASTFTVMGLCIAPLALIFLLIARGRFAGAFDEAEERERLALATITEERAREAGALPTPAPAGAFAEGR